MVKDSKPPKVTGLPRPFIKRKPGQTRDGRIMMRVHEDVENLIQRRAEETGDTRSRYLEKLLIGWLSIDPRNPKLGPSGARVPGVLPPEMQKAADPTRFGARWQQFSQVHEAIFGNPPSKHLLDDFLAGAPADGDIGPMEEVEPAKPVVYKRPTKRR